MPAYFLPYPVMSWQLQHVLLQTEDRGEAMRDPGKGVNSLPVSCKAWTALWDSNSRSHLQ